MHRTQPIEAALDDDNPFLELCSKCGELVVSDGEMCTVISAADIHEMRLSPFMRHSIDVVALLRLNAEKIAAEASSRRSKTVEKRVNAAVARYAELDEFLQLDAEEAITYVAVPWQVASSNYDEQYHLAAEALYMMLAGMNLMEPFVSFVNRMTIYSLFGSEVSPATDIMGDFVAFAQANNWPGALEAVSEYAALRGYRFDMNDDPNRGSWLLMGSHVVPGTDI